MKLLRNSYREILILLYFSIATFLPVMTVLGIVHGFTNFNLLVQIVPLLLAVLIATFLSLVGVLVFYMFLSAILQARHQNVESFSR